ncbi:WD domain containing protein [Entamoeba marina]
MEKKYDGVHTTVKLKGSIIEYIPNDGKNVKIEIPHIINTTFPESHRYLTLIVDTLGSVLVYDHLYQKTVMYPPPLPSAITTIEYFYPLCVMLLIYADGRSFVWSLDTGSLLSTLHYSLPQDRVRSTIIYQNQQTKK